MSDPYSDRHDPDEPKPPRDRSNDPDDRDQRGRDDDDRPRPRRRNRDDDIDAERRPRRRYRDDDDDFDDDRPRRRKKSSGWIIVLCCVAVFMFCLIPIGIGLLLPAVQQVRVAAARISSSNNLKQMGLAAHNYNEVNGTLPPAAITDKRGKPLLSWRVAILPFVEQQQLYNQFKLDEPWDGPNNIKLLPLMPKIYAAPGGDALSTGSQTRYRVFQGKGTAPGSPLKAITDGPENTILIVEAADPVPWTKPEELEYSPTSPLPRLGGAWSNRGDFLVCMVNGEVHMIKKDNSDRDLRAAIIIDDKQIPGPDFKQNPR
jgi:Protein of unknown function (DUF1559)